LDGLSKKGILKLKNLGPGAGLGSATISVNIGVSLETVSEHK
jgi:hypothetical protein